MQRERLTITVDPDLLEGVDLIVDKNTIRNRSHALEHLVREGLGLRELQQAFFFFSPEWLPEQVKTAAQLCLHEGIATIYLGINSAQQKQLSEIENLIYGISSDFILTTVPTDFGDGGSLILQKERLTTPFLALWLDSNLHLPKTLIAPYIFHRQHHCLLTQVLHTLDGQNYTFSSCALIQPELIDHISAGIISLRTTTFPELVKAGKVRGYNQFISTTA